MEPLIVSYFKNLRRKSVLDSDVQQTSYYFGQTLLKRIDGNLLLSLEKPFRNHCTILKYSCKSRFEVFDGSALYQFYCYWYWKYEVVKFIFPLFPQPADPKCAEYPPRSLKLFFLLFTYFQDVWMYVSDI